MRDKFNILREDDQKMYNKWVKGIAKQEAPSQVITVDDIINRYRNSTSYEAPKQLPYGLDNVLNSMGDIFVKCANLRRTLAFAMRNPVVSEHVQRVNAVKNINDKMNKIQEMLFSCTEDLNKIVENPQDQAKLV
jgi:purine nucleoside phosphorylase